MDAHDLIASNQDDNGYIKFNKIDQIISNLRSESQPKSTIKETLEAILINNNASIHQLQATIKAEQSIVQKSPTPTPSKLSTTQNPNATNQNTTYEPPKNIDDYLQLTLNCDEQNLNDLLFNFVQVSDKLLEALLVRLLFEKVSFLKLARDFEKDNDLNSVKECRKEITKFDKLMQHIKKFGSIEEQEIEQLQTNNEPMNQLYYLTIGEKNLPLEDLDNIPIDYYPTIKKLLIGMQNNRFNKVKRLNNRNVSQVSSHGIRIFFDKIDSNSFIILGFRIKRMSTFNTLYHNFIDSRVKLNNSTPLILNDTNFQEQHIKVLSLLNTKKQGGI